MWNMGIENSYTLEASFCGSSRGDMDYYHFCAQDYEAIGYQFCHALVDFSQSDGRLVSNVLLELQERLRAAVMNRFKRENGAYLNPDDIPSVDLLSELESDTAGSDSSVSDGLPMQILHASVPEISKKKRLKTRKERNKKLQRKSFTSHREIKTCVSRKPAVQSCPDMVKKKPKRAVNSFNNNSPRRGRLTFSTREDVPKKAPKSSVKCSEQRLSHSYIQAGLFDASQTNGMKTSIPRPRSCSSCEKCLPTYYIAFEATDDYNGSRDDIYDVHVPGSNLDGCRPFDLARRLEAYNFSQRHQPVDPSDRSFSSTLSKNTRNTLLRRQTIDQGDNVEYLKWKLNNIKIRQPDQDLGIPSYMPQETVISERSSNLCSSPVQYDRLQSVNGSRGISPRCLLVSPHTMTAENLTTLPKLKNNVKSPISTQPRVRHSQPLRSHSIDLDLTQPRAAMLPEATHQKRAVSIDRHRRTHNASNKPSSNPKIDIDETCDNLRNRLLSLGGSGALVNLAISVNQTKGTEQTATVADMLWSKSSTNSTTTPMRALTPQQYRMFNQSSNLEGSSSTSIGNLNNDVPFKIDTKSNINCGNSETKDVNIEQNYKDTSGKVVVNLNMNISPLYMEEG